MHIIGTCIQYTKQESAIIGINPYSYSIQFIPLKIFNYSCHSYNSIFKR